MERTRTKYVADLGVSAFFARPTNTVVLLIGALVVSTIYSALAFPPFEKGGGIRKTLLAFRVHVIFLPLLFPLRERRKRSCRFSCPTLSGFFALSHCLEWSKTFMQGVLFSCFCLSSRTCSVERVASIPGTHKADPFVSLFGLGQDVNLTFPFALFLTTNRPKGSSSSVSDRVRVLVGQVRTSLCIRFLPHVIAY